MKWNWQQPDWPRFSWSPARLLKAEEQFLLSGGVILGAVSHLDAESRDRLTVEAMSEEAVTSSEIEGEILDRDSVQSSIGRQLESSIDSYERVLRGFAEAGEDELVQVAREKLAKVGKRDIKLQLEQKPASEDDEAQQVEEARRALRQARRLADQLELEAHWTRCVAAP